MKKLDFSVKLITRREAIGFALSRGCKSFANAQSGSVANLPPLQIFFVKSIYSITLSLVKKLLRRNFCKKIAGEKCSDFHTIPATLILREINFG